MALDQNFYPSWAGANPIHEVRDWSKVRSLIRSARRGDAIPAILIDGQEGSGNLLNGTHRAAANCVMRKLHDERAAWDAAEPNYIDHVFFNDDEAPADLAEAVQNGDYERIDEIMDR